MFLFFKFCCLALYAAGLASVLGILPAPLGILGPIAAFVLAAHVLEVAVMFKHVRRYKGSLAMSIFLTVLFGFLHWKPIADGAA
ncbi:MAG: hypothetical protein WC048_18690 [Rhizobium sp.]|jgi:hypothetical protein